MEIRNYELEEAIRIEEYNSTIVYIQRIFEYELFLGVLGRQVRRNKYYYNDRFNFLYDLSFCELENLEQMIHGLVIQYSNIQNGE